VSNRLCPYFTVLTPTYNRRELLLDVYASLRAQSYKNFEWIVVDDGSTDGTKDLVEQWKREAAISIHEIVQPNRGKKSAVNAGTSLASGELVVLLDSDDYLEANALEVLAKRWTDDRANYGDQLGGLFCTARTTADNCIGKPAPDAVVSNPARQVAIRAAGDKLPVIRRDLLLEFPYPEYEGERFIPEGLIWNRLSLRFSFSYVSTPLCVCRYQPGGLSGAGIRLRLSSPRGTLLYYREAADPRFGWLWSARAHINYWRFSFHFHSNDRIGFLSLQSALFAVAGWLVYVADKKVLKR
jgi:glycosyltransferase involved in cell wall biosynthesis